MTPIIRNLALAAMSLGASLSAHAAPTLLIDFESLASKAKEPKDNQPFGMPMLLTEPVQNIAFAGATVFDVTQTTRDAGYCCTAPAGHIGFIQTREGIVDTSTVRNNLFITLTGALAGGDIESISFDAATGSTDLEFHALDSNGKRVAGGKRDFNPSLANWAWVNQKLDFKELGVVRGIEFVNLGAPGVAAFAIDNMALTLAEIDGGTVPEPAALSLVALALAAAGIATTRRRRV